MYEILQQLSIAKSIVIKYTTYSGKQNIRILSKRWCYLSSGFAYLVYGCLCFWTSINFVCMSASSPYSTLPRYLAILCFSAMWFVIISIFGPKTTRRFATGIFFLNLGIIICLISSSLSFRGVKRWIFIYGMSYQPSEFLKITFPVVLSYRLSSRRYLSAFMVSLISIACLLLQPDIGNAILLSLVALAVVFFWGVRKRFMIILLLLNFTLVCVASLRTRYSTRRLENFLYRRHPSISYQSFRAIQAIENGGLIGVGAGKGTVKKCTIKYWQMPIPPPTP